MTTSLFNQPAKAPQGGGQSQELSIEEAERQHMARASIVFSEAKWAAANSGDRGEFEASGDYVERLEKLTLQESTNPETLGVQMVIVEKTILRVVESFEGQTIGGTVQGKPSRVGERVTQMFMFNKIPAMPAFKNMLAKIYDMPKDMIPANAPAVATSPRQPLAGTVVRSTKKIKPTQKGKTPFTYVDYHGTVSFTDLATMLDPASVERFYANGQLARLVAVETAALEAAKAAAEQPAPAQ